MIRRFLPLAVIMVLALSTVHAQPAAGSASVSDEWIRRAQDSQARGLLKQALEFAGKAVVADPKDAKTYYVRGKIHERLRQFGPAEADFAKAIENSPGEAALYYERGMARLRLADFPGSIADFDQYSELRPEQAAELWQRGIALFYAGRLDDGRRQFEKHGTVNPRDVENSAWHFLCVARLEGLEKARSRLLDVQGDTRVPMKEIQALLAGKGTVEAVEAAAEAVGTEERRTEARFYAKLYLALYEEARGQREAEARYIGQAVENASAFGIMGDIARLHAAWLAETLRKSQ